MNSHETPGSVRRASFIFAGGGTGGHLYPALAIIEQLNKQVGDKASCLIVCSDRAIDRTVLQDSGVRFEPVPAKPLGLRPRALWRFLANWGDSVRAGRGIIRRERAAFQSRGGDGPSVVVVAMGGFVAAPLVQAARAERCPVWLVNLDAVPGKANRWIARHAQTTITAATVSLPTARTWTVVPPIVRAAAMASGSRAECRRAAGIDPDRSVLLITGGSQGAGSINDFAAAFAEQHGAALKRDRWKLLHQCGKGAEAGLAARLAETYARAGIDAAVMEFCREMGRWWGSADLAISRAGAGSVAEAWSAGVPTIFMPYPYHKDQHQRQNAETLVRAGGAVCVTDRIVPAENLREVGPVLLSLLSDETKRKAMRHSLTALGAADGAERVASRLAQRFCG